MQKIIVNKFGGNIVANPQTAKAVVERIKEQINKGVKPVAVVSALQGVTDELEFILEEVLREDITEEDMVLTINEFINSIEKKHYAFTDSMLKEKEATKKKLDKLIEDMRKDVHAITRFGRINCAEDKIISYGEKLSTLILTELLIQNGINARRYTEKDIGIITDNNHRDADIIPGESTKKIRKSVDLKSVPVITGFCGLSEDKRVTTLGRGGSDTTATFIASCLKAGEVVLWKTEDGVLSADPRIVPNAETIDYFTYAEAREAGKIICDKAMQYVELSNIPLIVANIMAPEKRTVISSERNRKEGASLVVHKKSVMMIKVKRPAMDRPGMLRSVLAPLKKYGINIAIHRDIRETNYLVLDRGLERIHDAVKDIRNLGHDVEEVKCATVSLIGRLSWNTANSFNAIVRRLANPHIGAFPYRDTIRLQCVVPSENRKKLVRELHRVFIEKRGNADEN